MKLTHQSPLGAIEIPEVGLVEPGEVFEIADDLAANLLEQVDLFSEAPAAGYPSLKVAELRAIAAERGIELAPKAPKADIIAALQAHDESTTDPTGDPQ